MPARANIGTSIDLSEVNRVLDELGDRTTDVRGYFRRVLDRRVTQFYRQQFKTRGRHGGESWKANRPLTVELKRRPGHGLWGPGHVMVDTAETVRAFTNPPRPHALRDIDRTTFRRGVFGLPHVAMHHEGYVQRTIFGRPRRLPRRIPPRRVVPEEMPRSIMRTWERDFVRWLERGAA